MSSMWSSSPMMPVELPMDLMGRVIPPQSALLWEEDRQAAAPVASASAVVSLLAVAALSASTTPTSEAPVGPVTLLILSHLSSHR